MSAPYYEDDLVTLYHGDCRKVTEWLEADVLVTDPPYGRAWRSGQGMTNSQGHGRGSKAHGGIVGDQNTEVRDMALEMWGSRRGMVFGDPLVSAPARAKQALAYHKPLDAGVKGAHAGFRRDLELIYITGPWIAAVGGRSSVLTTKALVAGPRGLSVRYEHPHAKPVDLLIHLLAIGEPSPSRAIVADPFAGSGSTLIAAKQMGRRAIGVEIDERYCEIAARRLAQDTLFGEVTA